MTTPSYSLDEMYAIVRSKCFFGLSSDGCASLEFRFEWMSSIRPLRYFVVTFVRDKLASRSNNAALL